MDILTTKLNNDKYNYYFYKKSDNSTGCFINLEQYQSKYHCLIRRQGIFTNIFFPTKTQYPGQGWKIHVSTDIYNSHEIIKIVSSYLGCKKILFKFITNMSTLLKTTGKNFPEMQFGKFITIYTCSRTQTKNIGEELTRLLKKFSGIKVLTDRNFPNSEIVSYRYGGINPEWKISNNNDRVYKIKDGNNSNITDSRKNFFYLPNGVKDIYPMEETEESDLNKYFPNIKILEVIRNTNEGINLIAEFDQQKKTKVILKEGKHLSILTSEHSKFDGSYFKQNEAKVLKKFDECNFTPKFIDAKIIDNNFYLIEQKMPGISLKEFGPTNPILKSNHTGTEVRQYLNDCFIITENLIKILIYFTKHNMIISDISPDNFMYDKQKNKLFIVDLESVQSINNTHIPLMRTDGFFNPKTKLGTIESDISGIGLTIFYLFFSKSIEIEFRSEEIMLDIKYVKNIFKQKELDSYFEIVEQLIFSPQKINLDDVLNKVKYLHNNFLNNKDLTINKNPLFDKKFLKNQIEETFNSLLNQTKNQCKQNYHFSKKRITPYYKNVFSYSYGLAGIENVLFNITKDKKYKKLFYKEFKNFNYTDNLSLTLSGGLAGILYSLPSQSKLHATIIKKLVDYINKSEDSNFGLFNGYSGVGLSLINNSKLNKSTRYTLSLLATKLTNEEILLNNDFVGLAEGGAGIAYFLLRYEQKMESHEYDDFIYKWILHDFNCAISDKNEKFVGLPSKKGKTIAYPYLLYGTAGLLRVTLETYDHCPKLRPYLKEKIIQMAESLDLPYTAYYGYFFGAAGIVDTMIEFNNRFPSNKAQRIINRLLSYIMLHKFKAPFGDILILSDQLQGVGTDLGSGMIGMLKVFGKYCNDLEYDSLWKI